MNVLHSFWKIRRDGHEKAMGISHWIHVHLLRHMCVIIHRTLSTSTLSFQQQILPVFLKPLSIAWWIEWERGKNYSLWWYECMRKFLQYHGRYKQWWTHLKYKDIRNAIFPSQLHVHFDVDAIMQEFLTSTLKNIPLIGFVKKCQN